MTEEKFEKELNSIIKSEIPKSVNIDGKKTYISKKIIKKVKEHEINEQVKEGGVFPLAALIRIIFGTLGAAKGVAGGVAETVQSAKESQKADAQKKLAEEQLAQLKKKRI